MFFPNSQSGACVGKWKLSCHKVGNLMCQKDLSYGLAAASVFIVVYGIAKWMREKRSKQRGSIMCCYLMTNELI